MALKPIIKSRFLPIRSSCWLKSQLLNRHEITSTDLPLTQENIPYWITLNRWCEENLSSSAYNQIHHAWRNKRNHAKRKAVLYLLSPEGMSLLQAVYIHEDKHQLDTEMLILKAGIDMVGINVVERMLNRLAVNNLHLDSSLQGV
ncbi:MAG: hypothetical protein DIZ78_02655 [endosymbiont of Escarpia spicata]|uniref:Uncharacterized protein n=1 Tax=endosymbiont of Escarpia spicata TaxID=2200908 RepID=A0A370DQZ6_9GAMM|nr:MAG: hypothetical protein DIZ78_02655 [endosymbiont of Escarpia spicata]